MRSLPMKKKAVAILAGGLLIATAGGAYAYWTTSGTGTGTAATSAGTANLTFTQTALATAMFPGDSPQTLTVKVTNAATNSAYVAGVGAYITTGNLGCTGADYKIGGFSNGTVGAPTPLTWTAADLIAGGFANATSTIQFNNTTGDQSACKSAVVTVNYVAN